MKAAATWEHVGTLRPDPDNPVIHTDEEVVELRTLIAETVWTEPIVCRVSDRQIIAGHRRLAAALLALQGDAAWQLSDAPKPGLVPVRFVDVDEKTARRLNLASNALAKQSAWDEEVLGRVLREMDASEIVGIGFDEDELRRMLEAGDQAKPKSDPDQAPEPKPGPPDSQPGQVYELGPHRLWCGDNTDPDIRAAASAGVGAVVTDPPYGIGASSQTMGSRESRKPKGARLSGSTWDNEAPPVQWLLGIAPAACIWGGNYFPDLPVSADWLIWDKATRGLGFSEAELAWSNFGCRARVLEVMYSGGVTHKEPKEHITQKPLALIVWCLGFVPEGATVFDPFAGSGTTLIACAETGRVARCIELDPTYCDVIRRRWTRYAKEHGLDPGTGALDG